MMCDINTVSEDEKICRGCLSSGRNLDFVDTGDLIFYYSLLTGDQKLEALTIPNLALCWECLALLHRTRRFQAQVRKAHSILQDSLQLSTIKPKLSSLDVHLKVEYDSVLEETKPAEQPLFSDTQKLATKHDKVIIPSKYKTSATSNEEVINDVFTIEVKSENASDDSEDNDYLEADIAHRDTSPSEVTLGLNKDILQVPETSAKINLPIVVQKLNNVIPRKRASTRRLRKSMPIPPINKKVYVNKKLYVNKKVVMNKYIQGEVEGSLIKTPELLKLEIELKKLINIKKAAAEVAKSDTQKKSDETNLVNVKTKIAKRNTKSSSISVATEENCVAFSLNENESKIKVKTELDPDFNFEDDDVNYATDDSEEYKQTVKKSKKQPKTDPNSCAKDDDIEKPRKFKKIITHYKKIAEVVPYFTEIEMSKQDLKSTLEKDDAIVHKKKPIKCSLCGYMFKQARTLIYHVNQIHKRKDNNHLFKNGWFQNPVPALPEKSVWRCDVCDRMMRREHIVTHMSEYHRQRFWCAADGCEWREGPFWEREDVDRHWDAIHRQVICDYCQKRKKSKYHLEWHILEKHASKTACLKCNDCSKTFATRDYLKQHLRHVHGKLTEPEELRYCVMCDVTFKTIQGFKKHFGEKHSGKPRPTWPCEQCGKVLNSKTTYQNHVNIMHKGKTPYCCHICGKYLSKAQALQLHLNIHNNIKIPRTKPCPICGRMFQSNRTLRNHTYTHTGERPYKCPHCDAAFTQPHCLSVHLAKQHNVNVSVRANGTIVEHPVTEN